MQRIPDPTTCGDFLRRFSEEDVELLMEVFNRVRRRCWTFLSKKEKKLARIEKVGHRITGERRGSVEGAGWEFAFVARHSAASSGVPSSVSGWELAEAMPAFTRSAAVPTPGGPA